MTAKVNKKLNSRISCAMRRFDLDEQEVERRLKTRLAYHHTKMRDAWNNTKNEKVVHINRQLGGRCRGATRAKTGRAISPWNYLPYTVDELRVHLEKQFLPGMTWEKMELWHIDHIKPVSKFHFSHLEDPQFLECFALENLRPMWASDNIRKGAEWLDENTNPYLPGF